jgi:hypothetical protein
VRYHEPVPPDEGAGVAVIGDPRRLGARGSVQDMDEPEAVVCPYCGETVEMAVESDLRGSFVQDCEVCCNPWLVRVEWDGGERWVSVSRADGSE